MAAANMVSVRLSVCLSGQKLGSAWKILPVTARSTCSCDLIVQHVRTQSLASVISAKRLMVMIVVMGSSAVPAVAQECSSPSPPPFQPASNSERSTSAGRSFAGVPAFLLHCKNLCVLFSPASFFLSCYPFCPQITTRDRQRASVLATRFDNHGSLSHTVVERKKERERTRRFAALLVMRSCYVKHIRRP